VSPSSFPDRPSQAAVHREGPRAAASAGLARQHDDAASTASTPSTANGAGSTTIGSSTIVRAESGSTNNDYTITAI